MAPDIWAPGDGIGSIRTTVPFNTYTGEGPLDPEHYEFGKTSAAAPHVAGVTGLILSINPDLTASQVKDILFSTTQANDIVNAHAALLKALDELPARKSISSQTTAYNGGRRMIKTGDDLFLVYESGNQIYITESGNNGSTWSNPPTRLSDGEGQNKFPSITGNSSEQFVIWQRYTGYGNSYHHYDLYFAKNTGSGWTTAKLTNLSDIQFSTETNPLPVITYESSDRLLVCAKTSNAIQYVYSDNYGSSWTSAASISGTSSSYQNPGLSMRPATPATSVLVYDDGSAIYYRNRYTSSWSGAVNVSSGSGTTDNCYPSVEMDGNYSRNVAWQGFSLPLQTQVIVHRRGTGSFSIFDLNSTLYNPSITGHDNDKRSIVFYKTYNSIYRAHYNGSSWSLSFIASQGKYPNISTGSATAKYVWTDVSDSPYEIKLSNEQLPSGGLLKMADATAENPVENLIHHRSAILQDSVSSTLLWVEFGELSLTDKAGNSNAISLQGIDDEKIMLNSDTLFSYLYSEPVTLPSNADTVSWYLHIYGNDADELIASGFENIEIEVQLVEQATKTVLNSLALVEIPNRTEEVRIQKNMNFDISGYRGKTVFFKIASRGIHSKSNNIVPGVAEVYKSTPEQLPKEEHQTSRTVHEGHLPQHFELAQNYPNPFNPTTIIPYSLPETAHVTLTIYDILGRRVITLVNGIYTAGNKQVQWDGRDGNGHLVSNGVYIYRIEANNFSHARKLLFLK